MAQKMNQQMKVVLIAIAIIIAGILVGLTQSNVPDVVIGGGIGLLICYSAIRIFKESMDVNRTQL